MEVVIEYRFEGCTSAAQCSAVFRVYKYDTSVIDPAAVRNVSVFGDTPVQLVAPPDQSGEARQNATFTLTYSSTDTDSGFYLAIRDINSCLAIYRVFVFYYVCPAETQNLVQFEELPAPPDQSQAIPATAQCVPTARPQSQTGEVKVLCNDGRVWQVVPGFSCECDSGLKPNRYGKLCKGIIVW